MLGWIVVCIILGSAVVGAIGFAMHRSGTDPVIQARFDAWCR